MVASASRDRRFPPWLWAPSALYAVSAGLILAGVAQLLLQSYAGPEIVAGKCLCVGALNLYELVLLGTSLLLVVRWRVLDDAIALTVLICLFVVATATSLDTVAPHASRPTLLFGAAGFLLAGAKLLALERALVGRFDRRVLAGLAALLVWNFVLPNVLGRAVVRDAFQTERVQLWLVGWWALFGGAGLLLAAASRIPTGQARRADVGPDFLRSSAMRWLVACLLLAGTFQHAVAANWAFNLELAAGDFLPAAGVAALLAVELRRAFRAPGLYGDSGLLLAPLAAAVAAVGGQAYTQGPEAGLGLPCYPPGFALGMAAAVLYLAARPDRGLLYARGMGGIALAYAAFGFLLFGSAPVSVPGAEPFRLNGSVALLALAVGLGVLSARLGSAWPALASAASGAAGILSLDHFREFVVAQDLGVLAPFALLAGAGFQLVHCLFLRRMPAGAAFAGPVAFAWGVIVLFERNGAPLAHPFAAGAAALAFQLAVASRTRFWPGLVPGAAPLAVAVGRSSSEPRGWFLVGLSFLALAKGVQLSRAKSGRTALEVGGVEAAPSARPGPGAVGA